MLRNLVSAAVLPHIIGLVACCHKNLRDLSSLTGCNLAWIRCNWTQMEPTLYYHFITFYQSALLMVGPRLLFSPGLPIFLYNPSTSRNPPVVIPRSVFRVGQKFEVPTSDIVKGGCPNNLRWGQHYLDLDRVLRFWVKIVNLNCVTIQTPFTISSICTSYAQQLHFWQDFKAILGQVLPMVILSCCILETVVFPVYAEGSVSSLGRII